MKTESGKYLYLTNREISLVTSLLKTKKRNEDEESLLSTVIYQSKLSSESYPKYRKAAEEKLKKIDAYAFDNEEVMIDPVKDLIPVCPNCHAMIHRKKEKVVSIDELRLLFKKR